MDVYNVGDVYTRALNIPNRGDDAGERNSEPEEDDVLPGGDESPPDEISTEMVHNTTRTDNLLSHILDQVLKGHVNADQLMHWTDQLKEALRRGEITEEHLKEFLRELKASLEGTVYYDACCAFGK